VRVVFIELKLIMVFLEPTALQNQLLQWSVSIDNVKREGISQQELEWAKSSIINNFIFEFTSSAQIVGRRAVIAYDKLPKEFMETYREKIAAVTVDDVQ